MYEQIKAGYKVRKKIFNSAVISVLLVLGILVVYWPVSGYEFLNYDDDLYVTDNPHVCRGLTWDNVRWALGSTEAGFWQPLVWLSLMADFSLFHYQAGGYHITNVLFHIVSTLLLYFVVQRLTGAVWRSAIVAMLFALHPLHVESVAWVSARKDVLSTFFWMLTTWSYAAYVEKSGAGRYAMVFFFYALGLMSKPMVMTLPLILLLLDYWPLNRYRRSSCYRLIGEKLPLLVLSLPVLWLTFAAETQAGALAEIVSFPLDIRIANALSSYAHYICQMFWPVRLSVFYPHPVQYSLLNVTINGLLLLVVSVATIRWAERFPYLPVGWLWYLITLAPVIGLVQIGSHARADRYTYIALIGLFIALVWLGNEAVRKMPRHKFIGGLAGLALLAVMSMWSASQVAVWKDSKTLFRHALKVTTGNYLAHGNLGAALFNAGQIDEAINHLKLAINLRADLTDVRVNLGMALLVKGDVEEAFRYMQSVLDANAMHEKANLTMGLVRAKQGDHGKAIEYYRKALGINPRRFETHYNLGLSLAGQGRYLEATDNYRQALAFRPDFAEGYNNLAIALAILGRKEEARTYFLRALSIKPDFAEVKDNLRLLDQDRN